MANGRIRNNAIRASSVWDRYHAAWRARLNVKRQAGYKTSSFLHLFVFFLNQQPYRLFSSWPKPLYQSEALGKRPGNELAQPFTWKWVGVTCQWNLIFVCKVDTKTRFAKEAKYTLKMALLFVFTSFLNNSKHHLMILFDLNLEMWLYFSG